MSTTISEQIKAIQKARELLAGNSLRAHSLDAALNDAGSTLAALNLNPDHFEREMKKGEDEAANSGARDEYFDQLEDLFNHFAETPHDIEEDITKERILSISYDRVVELEKRVHDLQESIKKFANELSQ